MNKLKLNVKRGIDILKSWSSSFVQNDTILTFSNVLSMGLGEIQKYDDDKFSIIIGIDPLQTNLLSYCRHIDDEDFITIGTVMFHELRHYEHMRTNKGSKELQMSDLSKYNNRNYYEHNHDIMPHEIEAEYYGVMTMWKHLSVLSPKYADELMLDHLTRRATETAYPISYPENGFISRAQVENLFENAYERSLTSKRKLPSGYLKTEDEIAMMISDGAGSPRREYVQIYNQLVVNCTDENMASLVSYLNPRLQKYYPGIDFDEIKPEQKFGHHIPETADEIKSRIAENQFSLSVSEITENLDTSLSP